MYGHRALTSLSLTEMAYLEREKAINKHNIDRICLIPLYSSRVHGKYTWESQNNKMEDEDTNRYYHNNIGKSTNV